LSQLKQIKVFGDNDSTEDLASNRPHNNNMQIVIKSRPPSGHSGMRKNNNMNISGDRIDEEDGMMEMEEMPIQDYDEDD
jgi:hypothetical protein